VGKTRGGRIPRMSGRDGAMVVRPRGAATGGEEILRAAREVTGDW
jgi:hypothetical protein